ncbi:hypothetical protein ACIQ9R_03945 [Streptomyces sp. NPDC094447]|uniref:hypothetical protein n=1 Tax=Streptomyces sp. NPDC094447 TaxID=3366062 RepID=UPI00381182EC
MSLTSSPIPLLQGRAGALLTWRGDELVLERRSETLAIPARAVARVRAEARCVTVELRARPGTTPAVHRIEDVSEAAAVVFADAVNSLLPARSDEVDGAALVVVRSIGRTRLRTFRRRAVWGTLGALAVVIGLTVPFVDAADGPDGQGSAVVSGILGGITVLALGLAVLFTGPSVYERRLRRHGVTVVAERTDRPRVYRFEDGTGTTRYLSHLSVAPYEQVAYHPRDASDLVVVRNPFARFLDVAIAWLCALLALSLAPVTVWMVVEALR